MDISMFGVGLIFFGYVLLNTVFSRNPCEADV